MYFKTDDYVSVPLRGYGFEIMNNTSVAAAFLAVSVPLRGCGFEMGEWRYTHDKEFQRFRPLAGMWF